MKSTSSLRALIVSFEDPFQPGDQAFATALRSAGVAARVHLDWPGAHEGEYWDAHWPDYLGFYARALAHCRR